METAVSSRPKSSLGSSRMSEIEDVARRSVEKTSKNAFDGQEMTVQSILSQRVVERIKKDAYL